MVLSISHIDQRVRVGECLTNKEGTIINRAHRVIIFNPINLTDTEARLQIEPIELGECLTNEEGTITNRAHRVLRYTAPDT